MNILYINHYAGAPSLGMEYRPYYLAKHMIEANHNVVIAACNYSHLRKNNIALGKNMLKKQVVDGVPYVFLKGKKYEGNGIKRINNMLNFMNNLFEDSTRRALTRGIGKFDVVIASSTYPLDIYPAMNFAAKMNAALIYEVHDLWPLSPMELGNMSKYHPFIMAMQKAENDCYKYSNAVISLLPCAKEHMINHGLSYDKFFYIPNGIELDENVSIKSKSEVESSFSQSGKENYETLSKLKENNFLVGYFGAHGTANALDCFITSAEHIKNSNIKLVLMGQGQEKENLIKLTNMLNLQDKVIFLDSVPKTEVATLIDLVDACFISLQKKSLFRFGVSPNKMMDYMAAKKPIISAIDAGNDMVKDADCGISAKAEDPISIANAIDTMATFSCKKLDLLGENAYKYVTENHTYKKLSQDFIKVLELAVKKAKS